MRTYQLVVSSVFQFRVSTSTANVEAQCLVYCCRLKRPLVEKPFSNSKGGRGMEDPESTSADHAGRGRTSLDLRSPAQHVLKKPSRESISITISQPSSFVINADGWFLDCDAGYGPLCLQVPRCHGLASGLSCTALVRTLLCECKLNSLACVIFTAARQRAW